MKIIKKNFKQALLAITLLIFSFYYTNKSIEIIQNIDPIMKQIKATNNKYEILPKNAQIIGNKIIPGQNGKAIDYKKSYAKMKQYGSYNEILTTFKETYPVISVNDYYDKYIVSGNKESKSVALIFKLTKDFFNSDILSILESKNVKATFFIDGVLLEKNLASVLKYTNYELELLAYNNLYNPTYFESAKNYLESITKKEAKYCYADYDNKEIIELCSKLKMHTITPTIKIEKSLYSEIKEKLTNSAIISFPVNPNSSELSLVIDYIKTRGYSLVTLDNLLSESMEK